MTAENSTCLGCLVNPNWFPPDWQNLFNQDFLNNIKDAVAKSNVNTEKLGICESQVLNYLKEAWNYYQKLDNYTRSPLDDAEFLDAIHRAQQIIALRVARRVDPEVWKQP